MRINSRTDKYPFLSQGTREVIAAKFDNNIINYIFDELARKRSLPLLSVSLSNQSEAQPRREYPITPEGMVTTHHHFEIHSQESLASPFFGQLHLLWASDPEISQVLAVDEFVARFS